VSPTDPWVRFLLGLLAVAITLRLIVELLRPVVPFLLAAIAVIGAICLIQWWRNNRL
jgi:hypothetical protein